MAFAKNMRWVGKNMVTIKDIARESGYSISTVSRVLNHRNDVSPDAKKKIEEVVAACMRWK